VGFKLKNLLKTHEEREENLFLELLETVESAWKQEHELYENFGVDIAGFLSVPVSCY
jgi:DNA-binding ferritin-like protein (Dps family)